MRQEYSPEPETVSPRAALRLPSRRISRGILAIKTERPPMNKILGRSFHLNPDGFSVLDSSDLIERPVIELLSIRSDYSINPRSSFILQLC